MLQKIWKSIVDKLIFKHIALCIPTREMSVASVRNKILGEVVDQLNPFNRTEH
jgi:hypothetical protein